MVHRIDNSFIGLENVTASVVSGIRLVGRDGFTRFWEKMQQQWYSSLIIIIWLLILPY